MKRFLAAAATTALLATGGVAVAGAAQGSNSGPTATPTAAATPNATNGSTTGKVQTRVAARFVFLAGRTAAKAIGITPAELRQDVRGGQTIAQVATAHNVDPKTVETDVTNAVDAAIQKALTNGKLNSTQAAALKTALDNRVPNFVEHTPRLAAANLRARVRANVAGALGIAAKTIGVTRQELVTALRNGQTIAQVAHAHNVDPQTVINAIVQAGSQRIEKRAQNFVNNVHAPKQPVPGATTTPSSAA
jgi:transposase-like protein